MNKDLKILYIVMECVYIACVTLAAMEFKNASLLWWYVMLLFFRVYRGR